MFHYGGRTFEQDTPGVTIPANGVTPAPGAGNITLLPFERNTRLQFVSMVPPSTNVSGDNIGYIYFFTGYLDRQSNSLFVIDRDYLEAA